MKNSLYLLTGLALGYALGALSVWNYHQPEIAKAWKDEQLAYTMMVEAQTESATWQKKYFDLMFKDR